MMHVIYMAAGNSRRFGSNKLLFPWQGKPLYRHTFDLLLERQQAWADRCPFSITVVTQYEQILRELGELSGQEGLFLVYCADSKKGVSYTIRAGIQAVLSQYAQHEEWHSTETASLRAGGGSQSCRELSQDMWMFVVADQPFLSAASIDALLQAVCDAGGQSGSREQPGADACSGERQESPEAFSLSCLGRVGNPCVFSGALIPELLALEGDQGGRTILKKHRCRYIEIKNAIEFTDIDSVEDAGQIGGTEDVDGDMVL